MVNIWNRYYWNNDFRIETTDYEKLVFDSDDADVPLVSFPLSFSDKAIKIAMRKCAKAFQDGTEDGVLHQQQGLRTMLGIKEPQP